MDINIYQEFCPSTFIRCNRYTNGQLNFKTDLAHVQNGLQAEAGEIAAAYQKYYRGDYDEEELRKRLRGEMGGLLYYLAMMANLEGISLSEVLVENRDVLIDRQNRNKIKGDGDIR